MAGDWLKFDCSLPEKPETLALTVAMGWDDPDLTVGKLMRLFRWFDQHTLKGNAPNVTATLLDRIVGVTGFVTAVADVGWLVIDKSGISLHNFDKHNGATAKSRLLTAKRVANCKANASGNAHTVSDALPREEKRREEKKEYKGERSPNGSRLPADWVMTPEYREFCKTERPDLNPDAVAAEFSDYWHSVAGAKGRKADWMATWRGWVRKQFTPRTSYAPPSTTATVPSRPGVDPALAKAIKDSLNASAPSAEIRARMKQLSGART